MYRSQNNGGQMFFQPIPPVFWKWNGEKKREKHLPVKLDLGNVDYSWKKSYGSQFPQ